MHAMPLVREDEMERPLAISRRRGCSLVGQNQWRSLRWRLFLLTSRLSFFKPMEKVITGRARGIERKDSLFHRTTVDS